MVNFAPHALAALALSALVAAIPTTTSTVPFTFVQWVEDILANPEGDHLSPEEAVAAKNASVDAIPLRENARCDTGLRRANADDAAACLSYLAGLGSQGVNCGLTEFQYDLQMWKVGNAQVVGSKSTGPSVSTNCGEVARVGGLIFDSCWRADNTVAGSQTLESGIFQVNILGV